MKKLLVLMLVLGMASLANATVIDVVKAEFGDQGHKGTSLDPLVPSEIIEISIVLNHNPYEGFPSFDGYGTDGVGLDLEVSGPGTLSVVQKEIMVSPGVYEWVDDLQHHADFAIWRQSDPLVVDNAIAEMSGGVLEGLIKGPATLIWNLLIHCDGAGYVNIDLTLQDPASRYSVYVNSSTMEPYPEWVPLLESDLGSLIIHQVPEPATIALLGLGGLFLVRRRR